MSSMVIHLSASEGQYKGRLGTKASIDNDCARGMAFQPSSTAIPKVLSQGPQPQDTVDRLSKALYLDRQLALVTKL